MVLVSFSVVVTIGVLNVNFRTPATHKVYKMCISVSHRDTNLAVLLGHISMISVHDESL